MSPEKKRVAKKAITSEESTADADEDDWNKSPIRTITWGRDAPVAVLFLAITDDPTIPVGCHGSTGCNPLSTSKVYN